MVIKMNGASDYFNQLQKYIEKAVAENRPIDGYVKKQIKILEEAHDEFIKTAQKQGYDINQVNVGEIEIEQFSTMKNLAQKIGLPVEKYDEMIKNVRVRILGEENYKRFFGNK